MIKRFESFESQDDSKILLYYAFDWDDNILNMPTEIILSTEKGGEIGMSTADFATYRERLSAGEIIDYKGEKIVGLSKDAFRNFRDTTPDVFLNDVKKAISNKAIAPSWNDFIECLSSGALFAIITARGHESETMRQGVEWIIDNVLTENQIYNMYNNCLKFDYLLTGDTGIKRLPSSKPSQDPLIKKYLDNCDFVGVSAPSRGGSPSNPEKAKEDALMSFIDRVDDFIRKIKMATNDEDWKAMIGFSDDDVKNYKHIKDLVNNLHNERFLNISGIIVKGTKDPGNIEKISRFFDKPEISILEEGAQTAGLESSVLKFTQFGNMAAHLNPQGPLNRQDDSANAIGRATKYVVKNSQDILGKPKKRKKKKSSK